MWTSKLLETIEIGSEAKSVLLTNYYHKSSFQVALLKVKSFLLEVETEKSIS